MANWQASLLMQTLSTGSVLVLQRDKTDAREVPTLHGGDTFYGSLPDGDPFGGTVMERHGYRTPQTYASTTSTVKRWSLPSISRALPCRRELHARRERLNRRTF